MIEWLNETSMIDKNTQGNDYVRETKTLTKYKQMKYKQMKIEYHKVIRLIMYG